jgi:hypothetical protein
VGLVREVQTYPRSSSMDMVSQIDVGRYAATSLTNLRAALSLEAHGTSRAYSAWARVSVRLAT